MPSSMPAMSDAAGGAAMLQNCVERHGIESATQRAGGLGRRSARRARRVRAACLAATSVAALSGCAGVPNHYRDDSPSAGAELNSPTARQVYAATTPRETVAAREWESISTTAEDGAVQHWPLYFEDPFEDQGHARRGADQYRLGWEDWAATLYGYPRYTVNWMLLPVSAIVTPPWTLMKSDGELSRQALGYTHDAERSSTASQ